MPSGWPNQIDGHAWRHTFYRGRFPELQRILDASPTGNLAYLTTAYGRPFTVAGFGMRFREWCNRAGLPQCSAHGLRKAGAALAAENRATEHQLMAIFGWRTIQEAERYTKAARRKKMAGDAMPLLRRTKD
jgi:integrase